MTLKGIKKMLDRASETPTKEVGLTCVENARDMLEELIKETEKAEAPPPEEFLPPGEKLSPQAQADKNKVLG